jgi:hypothetical protein
MVLAPGGAVAGLAGPVKTPYAEAGQEERKIFRVDEEKSKGPFGPT